MRNLTSENQTFKCFVKYPVDSEPVSTHSLHCRSLITGSLVGVKHYSLGLLVSLDLAHSSKFGKASIALLHLLHNTEKLALCQTTATIAGLVIAESTCASLR